MHCLIFPIKLNVPSKLTTVCCTFIFPVWHSPSLQQSKLLCFSHAASTYLLSKTFVLIYYVSSAQKNMPSNRTLFTSSLTIKISLIFQDYLKKQYYQGNFSDTIKSYLFFPLMPFLVILNCKRQ